MSAHFRNSMTLETHAQSGTRPVYGLGTKKSYRGQRSEGRQVLHRVVIALGVVVATAALVLSFGLL